MDGDFTCLSTGKLALLLLESIVELREIVEDFTTPLPPALLFSVLVFDRPGTGEFNYPFHRRTQELVPTRLTMIAGSHVDFVVTGMRGGGIHLHYGRLNEAREWVVTVTGWNNEEVLEGGGDGSRPENSVYPAFPTRNGFTRARSLETRCLEVAHRLAMGGIEVK